ncbi:MAG: GatB/YqeY domain-containing protein [Candidatus Nanopelagicales bacterium]
MSTLKQTLQADLTKAIRARDSLTAATLRMALTAITTEEVAGRSARELSDTEVVGVLITQAKRRREAATAFTDAARPELAQREQAELAVLVGYLPEPMTQAEVADLVTRSVAAAASAGVTGMPAMGRVMKELSAQTSGRFDGGELAGMVRAALT